MHNFIKESRKLDFQHKIGQTVLLAICAICSVKIEFVGSKQSSVSILPKDIIIIEVFRLWDGKLSPRGTFTA